MSFFTDLETALAKEVKVIEADVKAVDQYFGPVLLASAQELAQAALQAVLAQAPLLIAGKEKLSAATSSVLTTLGADGKQVAISDAEAAVQAAYNTVSQVVHPTVPAA